MIARFGPFVLVAVVVIAAFALNPSITGVGYVLILIAGACTVWLLRVLYLDEVEREDRED